MKRIVVVGATNGIGKALVELYASRGFWVTLLGRTPSKLNTLVEELRKANPAATVNGVVCDLTDPARIEPAFQEAIAAAGHCDVFIYCAGEMPPGDGVTCSWAADGPTLTVNTVAAVHMLGLAANYFRAAGRGHIVGISSIAGDRGRKANPAYCASKAGMTTYLEGLRNRLAPFGVTVTTVKPGYVRTRLIEGKKGVFWAAPVDEAARIIADRVERKHELFYVYRRWWLLGMAMKHVPRFLFKRVGPP